tara:strand:- start:570 stop:1079 length:510 start_codon:yes stop_codon:yes gene_type:complete
MLTHEQYQKIKPNLDNLITKRQEERYLYLGILSEYQLIKKDLTQPIVYTKLNPHQHFLFKRTLHGLKMYKPDQVSSMHWDKKRRITKVWKRGQEVINEWKQLISYKQIQPIFRIFAKSELGRAIYEMPFEYLPDYKNRMTLKELGITYEDLILKFIGVGLLPKNYFSLK